MGAIIVFCCGEVLGRKKCIYIGAVTMFIGAALQATSFGVPHMIVGRIVWLVNIVNCVEPKFPS